MMSLVVVELLLISSIIHNILKLQFLCIKALYTSDSYCLSKDTNWVTGLFLSRGISSTILLFTGKTVNKDMMRATAVL